MTARLLIVGILIGLQPQVGAALTEGDSPDYKKAVELIRQLGNKRFSVREAASKQLLGMGRAAKIALLEAKDDADPEVAERCRKLLPILIAEDLKSRTDAFAADVDGKQTHDLPGWDRYQKLVGKDKEARDLFLQMLRSNPRLFEQYEFDPANFPSAYETRCAEMPLQGSTKLRGQPPSAGDVAVLFFFGSDPAYSKLLENNRYLANLLYQPVFQTALRGSKGSPLRALFFLWMEHRDDPNTVTVALSLIQQFTLKEGIPLTARILNDKSQNAYFRAQAMAVLGKLGAKENAKDFVKVLKDETQLQPFTLKGKTGVVQLRDVALAMSIHLNGQQPKEFGFEFLDKDSNLWSYYHLGFESDESRGEAFKKWQKWVEDQNKKN